MGAAGMSGFGALLESVTRPRAKATWPEILDRQDRILDSLRAMCFRRRAMVCRLAAMIDIPMRLTRSEEGRPNPVVPQLHCGDVAAITVKTGNAPLDFGMV